MSFGFGSGGFGSSNNNNNNQQSTGFGGFGSNAGTGFGQQPQNTGFGGAANNTGGSLFGSGGSGFGASNTSGFGAKPAFGSTATGGGGLFGGSTPAATGTGFGGFGSNTNTTNAASSPFGGGASSGGGLFGTASKPAFGTGASTGGGLFGSGSTGSGFGQSNTQTGLFGAPQSTSLGPTTGDCQGTGSTPFQAFTEKDAPNSSHTNHFQSISFMAPYNKFSFEELRLADYNQGRRYGNGSGQAGAFGTSTGFGGFGTQNTQNNSSGFGASTGTGLFGSQPAASSSPFGTTTQTTGAFGSGTGGGLFGAAKPATGLFGTTPAATSSQSGSGLFGTSGQTGFGTQQSTGFGSNNTGGGLFGNNAQQPQKSGFSFGTGTNSGTGTTGFGAAGSGTGLFGTGTQGTSAFGQQQAPASNPFGTQPSQTQPAFGGFGATPQKSNLFGTNPSTTGGGLFGNTGQNNNQQSSNTNPFGSSTTQPAANSLFGPKPAASAGTGTGLFGNNPTNQNTSGLGGGLFGNGFGNSSNNQNQQNQGNNLFGNTNNQQPGLFGNSGTGGGLFGNSNTQQSGSGLFGNTNSNQNQQQQSGGLFGSSASNNNNGSSLFGNSQSNSLQPPQAMTASITDRNPYGSSSIFNGLPPPPQASPGPIATPISAGYKARKQAPLPQYKINPIMSSRYTTPQKRGYGFSYSTYGTPSSAISNVSTPGGLSSSLLGSSIGRGLGRGLGKSLSAYNLRGTFDSDGDGILSPGAFSADSTRYSGHGSLKKLTIDRNLRTDLFGSQAVAALPSPDKSDQSRQQPGILKKKVSFDTNTLGGNSGGANDENGGSEQGETSESSATPSAQEQGFLRSSSRGSSRPNGMRPNGVPAQSEMEQVKGNELAIVHEDGPPEPSNTSDSQPRPRVDQTDPEPGRYYMKPSREELRKVPRDRLKKFPDFVIGREECGFVHFDQPVDLTTVDLDHIYDNIAVITTRSLTIYPHAASKPPLGHGLNVPATITLANSWPRGRDRKTPSFEKSGLKFSRHVDRLSKVGGTEFVKYDKDTGEWVFKVPHFTTYALDFDESGIEGDSLHTSVLSEAPDTPTPRSRTPKGRYTPMPTQLVQESSILSEQSSQVSSGLDDTFEFKRKRLFPGAFDDGPAFEDDQEMQEIQNNGESFLGERSAASPSDNGDGEPSKFAEDADLDADNSSIVRDDETDMIGSFPQPDADAGPEGLFSAETIYKPKSILKASQQPISAGIGTPGKTAFNIGGDWAEQLQQTVSPRKQDRFTLRESQANLDNDYEIDHDDTPKVAVTFRGGAGLVTSIDLMNSLFGQDEIRRTERGVKQGAKGKDFEWPYPKKSKTHDNNASEMTEADQAFHESYKPNWGPGSTLLYAISSDMAMTHHKSVQTGSILQGTKGALISEGRDIRVTKFTITANMIPENLSTQRAGTKITIEQGVPYATAQPVPFQSLAEGVPYNAADESSVWELAGILFDNYDDEISDGVPPAQRSAFEHRIRKDRLSRFWENLCTKKGQEAVTSARTAEERAIAYLSMHRVAEACNVLVEGKDFRLATLLAQIGGDQIMREDMAKQLEEWRRLNVLSEITEPVRALYELLSGNSCVCEGKKGPIEDRAKTFVISDRFNLDWKRAFGLRLWYTILAEEPIEAAVKHFALDLEQMETRKPIPSFAEHSANQDEYRTDNQDALWGLLKLYAESKDNTDTTQLAAVVMPQNLTENTVDARFSFQLYVALKTRFPSKAEPSKADRIIVDFATQLDSAGEWVWAAFVLLHVSYSNERQNALQCLIARHAADIEDSASQCFQTLVDELRIPDAWIWEAKALYVRAVSQNPVKEVDYLLRARNWNEAHNTLCRTVAPGAIVERDYSTLQHLLDNFGGRDVVSDWGLGGQVYEDYLRLIQGPGNEEKGRLLGRLLSALPVMVKDHSARLGFTEMVAVQEIGAMVGLAVLEDNKNTAEGLKVMQLPQTENSYLKHTQDLSLHYYKALMAGGK